MIGKSNSAIGCAGERMMTRIVIAGFLLVWVSWIQPAHSQSFIDDAKQSQLAPLSDPIGYTMLDYSMSQIPAFYIYQPKGETAGDFYKLNDFEVIPRWRSCFVGVVSQEFPTTFGSRNVTFVADIGAILELKGEAGLWGWGSRAEISVKIETNSDIHFEEVALFRQLNRQSFYNSITNYDGDDPDCVAVKAAVSKLGEWQYGGSNYIPIQEIFFGSGKISSSHTLTINGSLSAEGQSNLSRFLDELGIGISVEAAVRGGATRSETVSRPFVLSVPFAFIPLYVSDADYEFVTELIINSDLGGRIDNSMYSTEAIIELLRKNPKLRDRVFSIRNSHNLDAESTDADRRFIEISRDGDAEYIKVRNQMLAMRAHLSELGIGPDDFE